MGLAMELACARGCAISAFGASSSSLRMGAPTLSSRPQRVTLGRRMVRPVRAGEEIDTEETINSETEEVQTPSINTSSNNGSLFPTGRKWTGYVEKDTAGQTNIYSVEPTVYVSESGVSGGSNNAAVAILGSLIAIAGAATVFLTTGKNAPVTPIEAVGYNGPPLSYYISKFSSQVPVKAKITVEDSVPTPSDVPVDEEASA